MRRIIVLVFVVASLAGSYAAGAATHDTPVRSSGRKLRALSAVRSQYFSGWTLVAEAVAAR